MGEKVLYSCKRCGEVYWAVERSANPTFAEQITELSQMMTRAQAHEDSKHPGMLLVESIAGLIGFPLSILLKQPEGG